MKYENEQKSHYSKKIKAILEQLPDYCKEYFRFLNVKGRSILTQHEYALDILRFYKFLSTSPALDKEKVKKSDISLLENLTREDFLDYYDYVQSYKDETTGEMVVSKPETIARKMSALRSFLHFYFKDGKISRNLAEIVEVPDLPDHEIVILEQYEIDRLFNAIKDTKGMDNNEKAKHDKVEKRDYAILFVFLGTGIRVSELVGLNIDDYDEYNASLLVKRKGGDFDTVYITPEVEAALKDYINNSRKELVYNSDTTALFVSLQHNRLTVRSVQKMLKKYADKADIPSEKCLSPHKLRKTFGSFVYNDTHDIAKVADALHHRSIETTKKHYAKISEENKRGASLSASKMFENIK